MIQGIRGLQCQDIRLLTSITLFTRLFHIGNCWEPLSQRAESSIQVAHLGMAILSCSDGPPIPARTEGQFMLLSFNVLPGVFICWPSMLGYLPVPGLPTLHDNRNSNIRTSYSHLKINNTSERL